ncbi:MAG: AAA family ATPase, partial [Bacteroidota bacterium]
MSSDDLVDCEARTTILNLCSTLQLHPRIILMLGEPGYGKSANLDDFKERSVGVFLLRPYKSWNALRIFKNLLKIVSPKSAYDGNELYDIIQELISAINKMKRIPVIILDEAGKVPYAAFPHFQELFDSTKGRASYIFSGPPYVERNIKKAIKADYNNMAEFRRRINEKILLPRPKPHELAALCHKRGIADEKWIEETVQECETFSQMEDEIE